MLIFSPCLLSFFDLFLVVTFTSTFTYSRIHLFVIVANCVHQIPHSYLHFHHPFPSFLTIQTGQLRHVFPTASYFIISLRTINFKPYLCSLLRRHDARRYRVWLVRTHVFGWKL